MTMLTEEELRSALGSAARAVEVNPHAQRDNLRRISRRRTHRRIVGVVASVAVVSVLAVTITQLTNKSSAKLRVTPSAPEQPKPRWVSAINEKIVGTPQVIGAFTDPAAGRRLVIEYFARNLEPRSPRHGELIVCSGTAAPGSYRIESLPSVHTQCGGPPLPDPGHAIGPDGEYVSWELGKFESNPDVLGQVPVTIVSRDVARGAFYLADGSRVPARVLGAGDNEMPAYFLTSLPGHQVRVEGVIVWDAQGQVLEDKKYCALPMRGDNCLPPF